MANPAKKIQQTTVPSTEIVEQPAAQIMIETSPGVFEPALQERQIPANWTWC
jgi:hypothetical protein